MSAPFPVIVCGATTDDVESEVGKALLTEMLSNNKFIQADWSGVSVTGIPLRSTCYIGQEISSDIHGALELFERRTGMIGTVFVCNSLTSVV